MNREHDPSPTPRRRVLLAVTAHPDDETFGMGATLAYYASQGVEVHLVCATRGEVGMAGEEYLQGYTSIAQMRTAELECAAQVLRLNGVHFLDYRDSGMPNSPDNHHPQALSAQPVGQVADDIKKIMRRLKPQVVITFDPIGGYHHPDHIAIHRATVKAFHDLLPGGSGSKPPAWKPQKLYFHTMPHGFIRVAVKILPLFGRDPRKFGANQDIDLTAIAASRFPTHAAIDTRRFAAVQDEASACHASQGGREMTRGLQAWLSKAFRRKDTFMRDFPEPCDGEKIEDDLYNGVQD